MSENSSTPKSTPNYWDYLELKPLLGLQGGLEKDETQLHTDELHFIVTHQALELWFKLILAEIRDARDALSSPQVPEEAIPNVVHHLGRVNEILKLAGDTFSVMETLTPQDFMSFRDKLTPASGFQSFQMREMELLLGVHWQSRVKYGKVDPLDHIRKLAKDSPAGELALGRLEQVLKEDSLKDAMRSWVYRTPIFGSQPHHDGDAQVVDRFIKAYGEAIRAHHNSQYERLVATSVGRADELRRRYDGTTSTALSYINAEDIEDPKKRPYVKRYRAGIIFIESYRELPLLAWPRLLIDALVSVDAQMVNFRHRHARAVEKIIGRRVGTGGSSGVNYLDETTKIRVFHDLWTARTVLLPKERRPALENADYYRYVG